MQIKVMSPGKRVGIIGSAIEGVVTAVTVRYGGYVEYAVSYMAGGEHREAYFSPLELEVISTKGKVGLVR